MTRDQDGRQFRLLTAHCALLSLAMSMAGGFVGAYLLQRGFSLSATVALYAVLLAGRFSMRAAMLPIIRRIGMRRAMLLGAVVAAFQFLPLIWANHVGWLLVWILLVSVGECLYWPIFHAANAGYGGGGRRGRQVAWRQMACTGVSMVGPVVGGLMLSRLGPGAEFGIATIFALLAVSPVLWMTEIELGVIPSLWQSLVAADRVGLCAFAADGWMCAGTSIAWPMMLFSCLGSSFTALGWASSAAAVAGAVAGLVCGVAIDRGYRGGLSQVVTVALLAGVVMRVASYWAPWAAFSANALGSAVGGVYIPVLLSVIYDRAKRSGSAYQFHLSTEAGWDIGAILGCLCTAAIASSGVPVTLAILPAALGVLVIHRCIQAEARVTADRMAVDGGAAEAAMQLA